MRTTVYYFSGTGNSLAAARKIASILGETDLIPIASLTGQEKIPVPDGRVGIISPVYDMGVPAIVGEFLTRLSVRSSTYLFAILTYGGTGAAALHLINTRLREHTGRELDAGFMVPMPGNFAPLHVPPTGEKVKQILASADLKLQSIGEQIKQEVPVRPGLSPVSSFLQWLIYGSFVKGVRSSDENFTVSATCTSCGICASVCPTANITIPEGRPVWHHHCELCCGCLNFCPVQAIDFNILLGTKGRGRYHHPAISVADMRVRKGLGE
jgi:ferredoxin